MTHLEAINAVEERLTALGLIDIFGDPIEGIEATGILAKFHGPIWDRVVDDFEAGAIDPDSYLIAMEMLIEEFNRYRYRDSIEKLLLDIRNEQGGAA